MKLDAGVHFHGGPKKDARNMIRLVATIRDEGGLPPEASLVFSQLLLNLAGKVGRARADEMIGEFFDAADVRQQVGKNSS